MELSRIIEIVRFKKTAGNGIQSPSIEEAQELARDLLIATQRAQVLTFKDPLSSCEKCGGTGIIQDESLVTVCECSQLDDPIYIIQQEGGKSE